MGSAMGALLSRIFAPSPDTLIVGNEISRGAYGTVCRGTLGARPVAIKTIHQLLLDCAKERREDLEAVLKRFRDECELMEAAKHANLVEFIGVFDQDGSVLLVMELMDQTLEEFLEKNRGTLPLSKQSHIVLEIAQGLMFLHRHDPQILHRDLTAKNVLMNKEGNVVKIGDLGQAKFCPSSVMYLTSKAPGCITYMPPECLVNQPQFTDKGDVFSLGVVALQVSTQEPPSVGLEAIGVEKEVDRRSADLSRLPVNHPMKKPILKCLQDDPAKRPSCKELIHRFLALSGPEAGTAVVKHPLRDWRKLGKCQMVIQHSYEGGVYVTVAVNSEGLLAVADKESKCVHLLTKNGTLVRSIGKRVLGDLFGVAFDLKGNVWVTDCGNNRVVKLSQDGRHLRSIHHAGSESDCFSHPYGMSVSAEGRIYICDPGKHRVAVYNEEGKFLFTFGSKGSGPRCFVSPRDIAVASDGLVYVTDYVNSRVCVWSEEGTVERVLKTKYAPTCIAATSDDHLLITSWSSHLVMVYTLEGELVNEFAREGSDTRRFNRPLGICVDDSGVVYVTDWWNKCVQVF